ncbi:MAG: response regulator [Caulobacteraceae bacterium]|nr:response regulator [Caulobacteraceae bacterium]
MGATSAATDTRSVARARATTVGIVVAAALVIGALMFAALVATTRIEVATRLREERLVDNGLRIQADEIRRTLSPNTNWSDAVEHLGDDFDPEWARTYIGEYLWDMGGYQQSLVVDRTDTAVFATRNGKDVDLGELEPLTRASLPLVARVRARERAWAARGDKAELVAPVDADGVVRIGPDTYLVVVSRVQSSTGPARFRTEPAPLVVAAQKVDAGFLKALSDRYLLDSLSSADPASAVPAGRASTVLADVSGQPALRLVWKPHSPISHLMWIVGPPWLAILLALLVAPLVAVRNERIKRQLERESLDARSASDAKSAFLATMSHEIRTPLNGILGMTQAIMRDELTAEQRSRIEVVHSSGQALLTILNDILDLSKIEAGKLELERSAFDVATLVEGAHAAFTALASQKGLSFEVDVSEPAQGVYEGDPLRIRQVLLNLISNAVKFTSEGGVRVEIEATPVGLSFSVSDDGVGIAPDRVARLFEKFVQEDASTTRRYGGTGLGLSICRELCAAMGGVITAESRLGEGSRFSFELPLTRIASAPQAVDQPSSGAPASPTSIRILAAEDNPINQQVLKALLGPAGVELMVVGNGEAALDAWSREAWDVVLMDVQMPVMDGPTASQRIRLLEAELGFPRTPIIALTANVMPHQIESYLAAGMDTFVAKPIEVEALFAALEAVLGEEIDDAVEVEPRSTAA